MQFQSGSSGNPHGRPKGTGHRQMLFNEFVVPHQAALFEKAINLALTGNETMLRLFLERMLPAKPQGALVSLELPDDIANTNAATAIGEVVLRSIAAQDMTPAQGKVIFELAQQQQRLVEIAREEEQFDL